MKIDLNKDFEVSYKPEAWKGFSKVEFTYGLIAALLAGAVALFLWKKTGISIIYCVYVGIPIMAPIMFLGIYRFQGQSWYTRLKEMIYYSKTKELALQMEERGMQYRIFSMEWKAREGRRRN